MTFSQSRNGRVIAMTMRLLIIGVALAGIFLISGVRNSSIAGPDTRSAASSSRVPVLIELFTSEGCSSCPPADVLLGQLDRFQPVAAAEAIVLSEHVDYWDDIGWKDPYSSRQFSLRQRDYARRFRLDGAYTPQMVVDGNVQLVGSDEREALRVVGNAAKVAKVPVSLSSPRLEDAGTLIVQVAVGPALPSAKPISGQVLLALADDNDQSNVRHGENAGRILKHVAVVRTLTQVGVIDGSGAFSKEVSVSTGNANLQNLRIVAIVQEAPAGRILGVGSTRLSN
jgi:hypothetical protein